MCQAIEDMRAESVAIGEERCLKKGRLEGMLGTLATLVRDGVMSLAEASHRAGIDEEAMARYVDGRSPVHWLEAQCILRSPKA